jgi:hypothetical protein
MINLIADQVQGQYNAALNQQLSVYTISVGAKCCLVYYQYYWIIPVTCILLVHLHTLFLHTQKQFGK